MSVNLSSHDVERLARAIRTLVSPLDHASVDDWRAVVNRELKELTGADSAGFMLAVEGGPFIYSEEHDPSELARYPDFLPPPLADGTPFWAGLLEVGSGHLRDFYRGDLEIYTGSEYYQDYAGANGAHDTIAMAISHGSDQVRDSASLQLWHSNPKGRLFGEREMAMLKILRPAFDAGVRTQRLFGAQQAVLIDMLDTLNHAVRVCDGEGRRLHRSRALCRLLAQDPEAATIVAAIDDAVRVARFTLNPGPSSDSGVPALTFETRTTTAAYRVVVSQYSGASATNPLLLAAVERTTPVPLSEQEMVGMHGLTRAQARVASLIARGLSNSEIAERLCISPHTARRHTERILLKLGVRSRAEVPPRLLR